MSYDVRDRLIQTTSSSPVFGTASYAYDVLDNLTSVGVSGGSHARQHSYSYDASSRRLSAVRQTVGGALVAALDYDVQGNLSSKGGQTYQFDLGNRLRSVPGQETGYEYDGHGRRVHAQDVSGQPILSQYGQDGRLLYQQDHRANRRTDLIYLGNRLIAQRSRTLTGTTATTEYQHTDPQGTPLAVTNASAAVLRTREYEPYGQLVNQPAFNGPGYTGHVQDAATGLTYMQQRYYDPEIGVFLSVDPVGAYEQPIGQFHRYRYANSNPYRFTDPDGRIPLETIWDAANVAMGATSAYNNFSQGNVGAGVVDSLGVIVDVAATALPYVPGGASTAIGAARLSDRASDGARFLVTPNGNALDTSKDLNLVSNTRSTDQGGDFLQIHNTHVDARAGDVQSHTHTSAVHTNPNTGEARTTRSDARPTTSADIDRADSAVRSGEMRERYDRNDRGGP